MSWIPRMSHTTLVRNREIHELISSHDFDFLDSQNILNQLNIVHNYKLINFFVSLENETLGTHPLYLSCIPSRMKKTST